ncbi:MAG: FAD-dependent oxidoreductase [Sphingobacteriales bacterium]|nr:MAG: FAD-dependent oxidoreductase [Sphingobacteriales bacterium]
MAHSPLKYLLQNAFADAFKTHKQNSGAPIFDESRRNFIKNAGLLAASGLLLPSFSAAFADEFNAHKTIAIIGAGMAGLNAAYQLKKQGIIATVYEASNRTGGRMFTIKDKFGAGITTDLGGEFVDTTHLDIIQLAKDFNVDFYDLRKDEITEGTFYFEGKHYNNNDLKTAILPFVAQIEKDVKSLPEKIDYTTGHIFKHLDQQSVTNYLTNIGVKGWLFTFLSLVITREYGMEASEQSAINFLIMFTQPGPNGYELFGTQHEVLKIKGGSQHLSNKLHHQLKNQVRLNYTLTNISQTNTNKFNLFFKNKSVTQHITADYVILAIPFSILRNIPLRVKMPAEKLNCINNLGYGNSSKFIMGFNGKPWRKANKDGQTYTNLSFGCTWDSSRMQSATAGSLTVFGGGNMVKQMCDTPVLELSNQYLQDVEKIYPKSKTAYNQKTVKFCWPQNVYSKAAYSSFKTGQWSTLAGWEIAPVGNLFFAGEHCSLDFQGYMNGAAETGRLAAENIIQLINKPTTK